MCFLSYPNCGALAGVVTQMERRESDSTLSVCDSSARGVPRRFPSCRNKNPGLTPICRPAVVCLRAAGGKREREKKSSGKFQVMERRVLLLER